MINNKNKKKSIIKKTFGLIIAFNIINTLLTLTKAIKLGKDDIIVK